MRLLVAASFACTMLSTGCTAMHMAAKSDDLVAEARAVDQRFTEAFGRGDVDAVMECYWKSPDTVLYPPDALKAKGWDEIKAGFVQLFREHPGAKLHLTDSSYRVEGAAVLGFGQWTMIMPGRGGEMVSMSGRYSEALARRDGKMVIVVDHASLPLPPPADKAPSTRKARQRKA